MNDTISEPQATIERTPDYAIYKPNSRGNGAVVRFSLNAAKGALFLEGAPQNGPKQFDWDAKIIMKWTLPDLGQVLAVLQSRQPQAKLFHQSDKANSTFELTRRDDPEKAPYLLTFSRQTNEDKVVRKISLPIAHAEAAVLETALRTATIRLLGW